MSGPKKLEAIDVECPKCGAWVGENCSPVTRLGFVHITGRAKLHAARVRAASPLPGGRDGGRG